MFPHSSEILQTIFESTEKRPGYEKGVYCSSEFTERHEDMLSVPKRANRVLSLKGQVNQYTCMMHSLRGLMSWLCIP